MSNVKSILLVGVGGQGTILVSKILTNGLLRAGYDVKMSEIHGMAQRGGSVSTTIRYGDKVYSPVMGEGQADVLVAFEKMEAVRWSPFLKPNGIAVVNDYEIASLPIAIGEAEYPQGTLEAMKACFDTRVLDAAGIAQQVGNPRTMNIVLLGALIAAFGLKEIDWDSILAENLPAKMLEVNLKALHAGMEIQL
ncbi:indolepyruvate oxidoreductase subunit beta [Acidaminobacterium chupaoyuni]